MQFQQSVRCQDLTEGWGYTSHIHSPLLAKCGSVALEHRPGALSTVGWRCATVYKFHVGRGGKACFGLAATLSEENCGGSVPSRDLVQVHSSGRQSDTVPSAPQRLAEPEQIRASASVHLSRKVQDPHHRSVAHLLPLSGGHACDVEIVDYH